MTAFRGLTALLNEHVFVIDALDVARPHDQTTILTGLLKQLKHDQKIFLTLESENGAFRMALSDRGSFNILSGDQTEDIELVVRHTLDIHYRHGIVFNDKSLTEEIV